MSDDDYDFYHYEFSDDDDEKIDVNENLQANKKIVEDSRSDPDEHHTKPSHKNHKSKHKYKNE